jgi:hypothetical protein
MIAGFKDVSFDDSEHTSLRQLDDAALVQVSQRATHGLDGHSEVVGNIVTGDGECDAISVIMLHPRCHFQNERGNLLQHGDPPEDQQLGL